MARTFDKRKVAPGLSRIKLHVQNNLGVINTTDRRTLQKFRDQDLDKFDAYYENRQYDSLMPWEDATRQDEYVPIRQRKPRVTYNVAKVLVDKVASKLVGSAVFPRFVIEDDPEDTEFFRAVIKASSFKRHLLEPVKKTLLAGAAFVRFYFVDGHIEMEWAHAKYCYPTFDALGELESLTIKYVFEDVNDKDSKGDPKKKWYRMDLTKTTDTLFDTPEYREGAEPEFTPVETNTHDLGFVQGEWLRTNKQKFSPDGYSLIGDIFDFIDEMNYSLSQSSQASSYGQEPQLAFNKMDEDELENLIKTSQKAWNLGREGEAKFVETDLKGMEQAGKLREDMRNRMLEVVRVILHDPEKIQGNAQSGEALKQLYAPLIELIDELRMSMEDQFKNLLLKIAAAILILNERGVETSISMPPGYTPQSMDLEIKWPPIFPPTIDDVQKMTTAATAATGAKILSRESATKFIAQYFGVEDIEGELAKIAAEPDINPFGTF